MLRPRWIARTTRLLNRPWFALLMVVLVIGVFVVSRPHPTRYVYDQRVILDVLYRMHHGQPFYDAWPAAYKAHGLLVGCAINFRPPLAFWLWSLVPLSMLYALFIGVVVIGTGAIVAFNSRWPLVAVPVTAYLLHAGRTLDRYGQVTDQFLLVELWIVPLLAAGFVLYRRNRMKSTIALGVVTPFIREIGVALLVGGGASALWRRRPKLMWAAALVVVAALYVVHLSVASGHADASGNCVKLLGTGHPPSTILTMMDFPIPGTVYIGLALWLVAVWEVWVRGDGPLVFPLLAGPFAGAFVNRGYWGFTFIPFVLWWAAEGAIRLYRVRRRGAGWSRETVQSEGAAALLGPRTATPR